MALVRPGGGDIKQRIDDDITISDRRTYRPRRLPVAGRQDVKVVQVCGWAISTGDMPGDKIAHERDAGTAMGVRGVSRQPQNNEGHEGGVADP